MDLSMATGPEDSLLLLLLPATTLLPPLLAVLLLAASLLWLSPGGPAWALSLCRRPPPGPPGVVTALSSPVAHRVMAALSRSVHGGAALMSFSVGLTRVVVSSRQDTAREILVNPAFGDRPVKDAARHLLFHRAMGFAPSGDAHWRALRRLAAAHLFGPRRVAASAPHRSSIGTRMLGDVASLMARHGEVAPRRFLHAASLNHVMAVVFGKRYDDFTSQEGVVVEEMVNEGYDLLGTFNWADHLPFLKWLDLQGVRRRCNRLVRQVEAYVGNIIQEHKARRASGSGIADELSGDFVDVLLGLDREDKMSESDMIAVLWEMIFRGTDTVAILMEWIMARMVLHPEIQSKARAELDAVVGRGRAVMDEDVARLPYIQCIVKETLRMHPPGPLLSWARLAVHDAHVGGHLVPAGTTAMVNMWAIAHDAAVWPEPELFRPERFMEEEVSVLGSDLRLAPFGAGRRVCPGKMLALATVHLWLAQLLHRFEWAPATAASGGVDLSERLKMSLEMATPLVCRAVAR
ncbi:cytochrome P450 78A5-like [Triticum dicoccoides]|uniref:cytochrome P450 78A5-like n=1 Tax=Triticum dicoccoides TaxID=85692 RepID=UPI000E79A470|nr:cytochrome P450 78A5-like [Triticum dicoccoides]